MKRSKSSLLPARLARGRERFETWRKKHKGYHRLPESLWSAAVKLAGVYGVSRTAHALRLEYGGLKKRMAATASDSSAAPAAFVQLLGSELTTATECVIECEDAHGSAFRQ